MVNFIFLRDFASRYLGLRFQNSSWIWYFSESIIQCVSFEGLGFMGSGFSSPSFKGLSF